MSDAFVTKLKQIYPACEIRRHPECLVEVIGWGCIPERDVYYHTLLATLCYMRGKLIGVYNSKDNIYYSLKVHNEARHNFIKYFDNCSKDYLSNKALQLFSNPNVRG